MSYATRFFQSLGATTVQAGPARLTRIADAVDGRKALRHAFERARHGERNAVMLYPHQREAAKQLKKHIVSPKVNEAIARAAARENAPCIRVGGSYEPRRKNQHSKPYTVLQVYEDGTVAFRRGDAGKLDTLPEGKFLEAVKL